MKRLPSAIIEARKEDVEAARRLAVPPFFKVKYPPDLYGQPLLASAGG